MGGRRCGGGRLAAGFWRSAGLAHDLGRGLAAGFAGAGRFGRGVHYFRERSGRARCNESGDDRGSDLRDKGEGFEFAAGPVRLDPREERGCREIGLAEDVQEIDRWIEERGEQVVHAGSLPVRFGGRSEKVRMTTRSRTLVVDRVQIFRATWVPGNLEKRGRDAARSGGPVWCGVVGGHWAVSALRTSSISRSIWKGLKRTLWRPSWLARTIEWCGS